MIEGLLCVLVAFGVLRVGRCSWVFPWPEEGTRTGASECLGREGVIGEGLGRQIEGAVFSEPVTEGRRPLRRRGNRVSPSGIDLYSKISV